MEYANGGEVRSELVSIKFSCAGGGITRERVGSGGMNRILGRGARLIVESLVSFFFSFFL